jgi:outer membrane receptor protein involved in Fe transport
MRQAAPAGSVLAGRPARILWALVALACAPALADTPQAAPQELSEVKVIGPSPVPGSGIPIDQYPGNAQTISARAISGGTATASEALNAAVGSVNLNDTQGNPFQMDLNYRGFAASPVLGTPQGLSVYVDGMRVNEPFGDVVSWDLIPQVAIANITVIPGTNPVYGLNSLGGALAINTKSGFAFPGTSVNVGFGSFERRSVDAQTGGHQENTDYYLAASTYDERGWAHFNPSRVRQLFSKLGYQDERVDLDFSVQYVDDVLAGNQLVAQSMLANAAQGYSHPDTTATSNLVLNLTGHVETDPNGSLEGNGYYRHIARAILNSNINDPVTAGAPDQLASCVATYGEACASNILSQYTQDIYGLSLQLSRQGELAGGRQYVSAGISAETASTSFVQTGQDAIIDATLGTVGIDGFAPQSNIGARSTIGGIYATDTWAFTRRASLTASLRYDHSAVSLTGVSVDGNGALVNVAGNHGYGRANPALGGTFLLSPQASLFANLAQGFRTPSAIELACADPVHPCAGVPNAFSSDPNLKGIVARGWELGGRGHSGDDDRGLRWRASAFYTNLDNDILFNQSSLTTGYYSNVGQTRREGLELWLGTRLSPLDAEISATRLNATYQSSFLVADSANPGAACPVASCVPVQPGDRIPGIPPLIGKLHLSVRCAPGTQIDMLWLAQAATYARGDENNLPAVGTIPGFDTVKLGFTWDLGGAAGSSSSGGGQLYGGVSNVFNRSYASFGMLAANDLKGGVAENFWAVGQPRALYLGLRWNL